MNKVYWTTQAGGKVDIDEMSISHLRNTLKMIVRNSIPVSNKVRVSIEAEWDVFEEERIREMDEWNPTDVDIY